MQGASRPVPHVSCLSILPGGQAHGLGLQVVLHTESWTPGAELRVLGHLLKGTSRAGARGLSCWRQRLGRGLLQATGQLQHTAM